MLTASLVLLALGALPVAAESAQARVVRELRALGYTEITGKETWLGRYRIVATAPGQSREIVLNPYTGEVLRDYVRHIVQPKDGHRGTEPALEPPQLDDNADQSGNIGDGGADGQNSGEAGNGAGNSGNNAHE
ncbi:PepSY domain-containing protein [Aliiruegeria lutimaris]|nr:PepSY domain-containing protein [Aliiruegeria lutimaris]